jgi:hypothetical protein
MNTSTSSHVLSQLRVLAGRFALALVAAFLSSCGSAPKSEVVVSVKDQKLGLYDSGVLKKEFAISTSKFGIGDQPNSYRTPLGKHEVIAKIGHGLPTGAVLKSRSWNGEVLKPNAPGRDPIVSRILWLRGMEGTNRNAMKRYIYIHGTTEECKLGKPASYGCIRMGMKDVVEVFEGVGIGAKVVITRERLPAGDKAEEPKPTPEEESAVAEKKSETPAAADAVPATAAPSEKPKGESDKATAPVAKSKSKKPTAKAEKITTGNRRNVSGHLAHG